MNEADNGKFRLESVEGSVLTGGGGGAWGVTEGEGGYHPANKRRWPDVGLGLKLGQRRRK